MSCSDLIDPETDSTEMLSGDEIFITIDYDYDPNDEFSIKAAYLYNETFLLLDSDTLNSSEPLILEHSSEFDENYILCIINYSSYPVSKPKMVINMYKDVESMGLNFKAKEFIDYGIGNVVINEMPGQFEWSIFSGSAYSHFGDTYDFELPFTNKDQAHLGAFKEENNDYISYFYYPLISPGFTDTFRYSEMKTSTERVEFVFQESFEGSSFLEGSIDGFNLSLSEVWNTNQRNIYHFKPEINFDYYKVFNSINNEDYYYSKEEIIDVLEEKYIVELPQVEFNINENIANPGGNYSMSEIDFRNEVDSDYRLFLTVFNKRTNNLKLDIPLIETLINSYNEEFSSLDLSLKMLRLHIPFPQLDYIDLIQERDRIGMLESKIQTMEYFGMYF